MKSILLLLVANFLNGSVISAAIFAGSLSPSKLTDRALPPLVPPKLVGGGEDDDDFDERDLDLSPAHVQLRPSYWAPTLETLAPEEAEFYRKAIVNAIIGARRQMKRDAGRSMSMLRMGRSSDSGVRRSMTMLRMGRAFDEEEKEDAAKRSMGMLRMGRGAVEEDFRKSMSMLRMGRGAMLDDDTDAEDEKEHQQLRRSMGMLRMGRAMASKNVDRGALNMLRMGKREATSSGNQNGSGVAAEDKSSSSTSN